MALQLCDSKLLLEPVMTYYQLGTDFSQILIKMWRFSFAEKGLENSVYKAAGNLFHHQFIKLPVTSSNWIAEKEAGLSATGTCFIKKNLWL